MPGWTATGRTHDEAAARATEIAEAIALMRYARGVPVSARTRAHVVEVQPEDAQRVSEIRDTFADAPLDGSIPADAAPSPDDWSDPRAAVPLGATVPDRNGRVVLESGASRAMRPPTD